MIWCDWGYFRHSVVVYRLLGYWYIKQKESKCVWCKETKNIDEDMTGMKKIEVMCCFLG